MKWILVAAVSFAGAAMLLQTPYRGIDPDELEHVHAACAVSWGELPYRDFFEHHGPVLYYLLQPILRITGPELPALWHSRLLMWAAAAATLAVTGAIARRLAGTTAALAAPALLGCTTIFFQKAVELRPDVPAMFLIALAAYVCVAGGNRRAAPTAILVGILLGLATLFTQKAIVPALAMIFSRWLVSPSRFWNALLIASALAAAWLTAAGLFWTAGAAGVFLDATFCQLWRWPIQLSPLAALRPTLAADLTLWVASAAAVAGGLWSAASGRRDTVNNNSAISCPLSPIPGPSADNSYPNSPLKKGTGSESTGAKAAKNDSREVPVPFFQRAANPLSNGAVTVLSLTVLISFVGGLLIKAAYAQYYLLWLPLAAIVAADWLVRVAGIKEPFRNAPQPPSAMPEQPTQPPPAMPRWVVLGIAAALLAAEALLANRAICRGANGPLPHLTRSCSAFAIGLPVATVLAAIAAAAGVCAWRGRRAGAVLGLALLGLGYAGLRNLDALCWSNRDQVAAIERVCRLVGPHETVFDGYTGLGAFRRHAYYYWWLNSYSLRLMSPAAHGEKLLASLKQSPPKLICLDENLMTLPPAVLAWIKQNYRAIEPPLYVHNRPLQPVRMPAK